jgi:hypothetical protein
MQPFACAIPTLAVSTIYCLWSFYVQQLKWRRDRLLRERLAFMLWTMAQEVE